MRGCWGRVLIETLWNVNEVHEQPVQTGADRFNRNIVECKLEQSCAILDFTKRFNRNIVECKYCSTQKDSKNGGRF